MNFAWVEALTGAVGGYTLATVQPLIADWVRARTLHRRQLRTIRAELNRLGQIDKKYGWLATKPGTEEIPKTPTLTPTFLQTVAETDFYLTDQHETDNMQQSLTEYEDMCMVLGHTAGKIQEILDQLKAAPTFQGKQIFWERAKQQAAFYDAHLDQFQVAIQSGHRDLSRRLEISGLWRQVSRIGRALPPGNNPRPMRQISPKGASRR
jgi:hypothetical protein